MSILSLVLKTLAGFQGAMALYYDIVKHDSAKAAYRMSFCVLLLLASQQADNIASN